MFDHVSPIFPLIASFLLLVGCEIKKNPPSQPVTSEKRPALQVAICDLDEIAKELGLIDELNRILTRERTLLDNEIRKLQAARQSELKEKLEAYGEFPDDDQKQELAMMQAQARQVLLQAQNRASRVFAVTQENLVKQIRTKIKKPVDQVANKKGIHIVLTDRDESVLFTASAANITPEVLSAARNANLGKLEESGSEMRRDLSQETTGGQNSEIRIENTEKENTKN
tara:strand:+ start:960 stop:1640 length:681 start_codon:yes stop_codon:yes gene_type:complete